MAVEKIPNGEFAGDASAASIYDTFEVVQRNFDYIEQRVDFTDRVLVQPGPQGEPGGDGLPGRAGTLVISEVVSLAPTSSAFVENTGTEIDALLRIGIPRGVPGAVGLKGDRGDQGIPGAEGAVGMQGLRGLQGAKGDPGAKGDTGVQGFAGPAGAIGETGPRGLTGERGERGPEGPVGARGAPGERGERGLQGLTGAQGPQGVQGIRGATGSQGPQGPRGFEGQQGVQGERGADGTGVEILGAYDDMADLPATGENGDAYLVDGDLYVWTGDGYTNAGTIQGPQGIQGERGPQGIQGFTGAIGPKGDTGAQGIQGIKGDKGDQGIQGPVGVTGATGPKGDTGAQGVQGIQGLKGDTGATGATGAIGPKGDTGATGPQGSPDTAAQVLAKLITVDGTGSGLDADLLNGQAGSFYRDAGNLTGTVPPGRLPTGNGASFGAVRLSDSVSSTSGTGAGIAAAPLAVKTAYDLANGKQSPATTLAGYGITDAYTKTDADGLLAAKLNASAYTASDVLAKLLTVDGAGSGLDADILDGQSGAYYLAYGNLTGVPTQFPPTAHTHTISQITDAGALASKSTVNNADWSGTDLSVLNGGTGASTASAALANLGAFPVAGGTLTGAVALTPVNLGTLTGSSSVNFLSGNIQMATINGAVSFTLNNLPTDGGDLELHLTYTSGSIAFAQTINWFIGAGAKSTTLGDTGVVLTSGQKYDVVIWNMGGTLYGVIG